MDRGNGPWLKTELADELLRIVQAGQVRCGIRLIHQTVGKALGMWEYDRVDAWLAEMLDHYLGELPADLVLAVLGAVETDRALLREYDRLVARSLVELQRLGLGDSGLEKVRQIYGSGKGTP